MNQSGTLSRRHAPAAGPVRLVKSDGQFTPQNLLTRAKSALSSKKSDLGNRDGFSTCLAPGSLDRPNVRNMSCNIGSCPGGFASFGYEPGETYNFGDACYMRNMICVKNNYDTSTWSVVADCCNGTTAQKDCDPSLCRNSKNCRDKMIGICDAPNMYGDPRCQKWLNSGDNDDVKATILSKYCMAESLSSGPCRAFAQSQASHGRMDAAVNRWCTGKIAAPPAVDPKLSEYTRWRYKGGPQPTWFNALQAGRNYAAFAASWEQMMKNSIALRGIDETANPTVTYLDNSKDPICACILSPLNKIGDKAAPPSCFDTSCVSTGYQTGGMRTIASKCPSWVECRSNILAASGGSNANINVQQICGPPPAGTPSMGTSPVETPPAGTSPTLPVPPADDIDKLREDEKRGQGPVPPAAVIVAVPGFMDQLKKPFAPALFGDTSIGSVAILFFAIVIISAILWRTWMNRRSRDLQLRMQAEQDQLAMTQSQMQTPSVLAEQEAVQTAIQSQMSQMPRMTATS